MEIFLGGYDLCGFYFLPSLIKFHVFTCAGSHIVVCVCERERERVMADMVVSQVDEVPLLTGFHHTQLLGLFHCYGALIREHAHMHQLS